MYVTLRAKIVCACLIYFNNYIYIHARARLALCIGENSSSVDLKRIYDLRIGQIIHLLKK